MSQSPEPPTMTAAPAPPQAHAFAWLPYARLLRLPNVFTAVADVGLAALVGGSLAANFPGVVLLALASACLYCSGMVWNDYFDVEQDRRERPFRPLPSGRIALGTAWKLAALLMAVGVALAGAAGLRPDGFAAAPLAWAVVLAVLILLYDRWLKHTALGPVGMGACRFCNVMLGLSIAAGGAAGWGVVPALVVGFYIVGVTWFARTEARASSALELAVAAVVMLFALVAALAVPVAGARAPRGDDLLGFVAVGLGQVLFPYLLVAFGFYVGAPVVAAVRAPAPARVQAAVKRCVLGLILLDALLAAALVGTAGLLLALLLAPALLLGRRIYST
jgi:4-hydroxybenzoate polyprenyltransferase